MFAHFRRPGLCCQFMRLVSRFETTSVRQFPIREGHFYVGLPRDRNQSMEGGEDAQDIRSCRYAGRGEPHLRTFGKGHPDPKLNNKCRTGNIRGASDHITLYFQGQQIFHRQPEQPRDSHVGYSR